MYTEISYVIVDVSSGRDLHLFIGPFLHFKGKNTSILLVKSVVFF